MSDQRPYHLVRQVFKSWFRIPWTEPWRQRTVHTTPRISIWLDGCAVWKRLANPAAAGVFWCPEHVWALQVEGNSFLSNWWLVSFPEDVPEGNDNHLERRLAVCHQSAFAALSSTPSVSKWMLGAFLTVNEWSPERARRTEREASFGSHFPLGI